MSSHSYAKIIWDSAVLYLLCFNTPCVAFWLSIHREGLNAIRMCGEQNVFSNKIKPWYRLLEFPKRLSLHRGPSKLMLMPFLQHAVLICLLHVWDPGRFSGSVLSSVSLSLLLPHHAQFHLASTVTMQFMVPEMPIRLLFCWGIMWRLLNQPASSVLTYVI